MKNICISLLVLVFLTSCSSYNRIITVNDEFKNEKSIRLIQELEGYSDEKQSRLFDGSDYLVKLKTLYVKPELQEGSVTAEITITTNTRPEEVDSLIFIETNNEKFKFHSREYTFRQYVSHSSSTETTTSTEKEDDQKKDDKKKETTTITTQTTTSEQSHQVMKRTIEISPDKWHYFMNPQNLKVRIYIGSEGVDVHFKPRDRKKFALFFTEALESEGFSDHKVSL